MSFSTYKKQLYIQTSQIVKLLADNVDNKLERISSLSFDIMTDDDLQESLMKINAESSSYQKLQYATELRAKLLHYPYSEKYIESIGIIDLDNNQYFEGDSNTNITTGQLNQIENSPRIDDGIVIWIQPSNNDDQILAVRSVRQIDKFSFSKLGILVVKINKKKLLDSKFDYFSKTGYYFTVFSKDSIIIEEKNNVDLSPFQLDIHDKEGYFFKSINKKNYLINYNTFNYTGWQFAFALPIQNIMLQISEVQIIIVLIYLVIFIFTTYVVIIFSSKIAKPLEKLMANLKDVKTQWFNSTDYSDYLTNIIFTHSKDEDEIRFLERDFKILVDRINSLLKENYDEKIIKKEWQLKALQRQINPHFLYNTLDSLYWLSKLNKQEQISIIIKSLGNLLRNSIYKADNIITIGEEVEILRDYINIQKFRFQDRLNIIINIDEKLMEYKIPNLTIQTIVENSISHGLEVKAENCTIDIYANLENDDIKITILDNGPGVNSEMLTKLRNMEIEPDNSGIGIKNVDQRIKLIFGNSYGLVLNSLEGKWFRVDILIPCRREVC
jgi:two-component system sensor histidine kinase YesM